MSTKTGGDGLAARLMRGSMYGIYLRCETCRKTIGGEQVTEKHEPPLNRREGRRLRELAAERGWTHTPPDSDLCPDCSVTKAPEV